jgi:hypothetical protein
MRKSSTVIAIFILSLFLLSVAQSAFAVDWLPLVPCGLDKNPDPPVMDSGGNVVDFTRDCTRCDLFKLLHNLISAVQFGVVPIIGGLLFVIAGIFYILGGTSPEYAGRAKIIFTNTIYGIIVVFVAWLIVNTVLVNFGTNTSDSWYQFQCRSTAPTPTPGLTPIPSVSCDNIEQLAAQYNVPHPRRDAPGLTSLMRCIAAGLSGQSLGSIYTYEHSNGKCNYTRGNEICGNCAHAVNSCHYGGASGSQGALAVDYGNEQIGDDIIRVAFDCGAKFARCETAGGQGAACIGQGANHVHVTASSCDRN